MVSLLWTVGSDRVQLVPLDNILYAVRVRRNVLFEHLPSVALFQCVVGIGSASRVSE